MLCSCLQEQKTVLNDPEGPVFLSKTRHDISMLEYMLVLLTMVQSV